MNDSDHPDLSADAVLGYLLAGHLQIAYGALPTDPASAGSARADTLCALRARLVRSAESALPFRVSPAADDEVADASDDPIDSATSLLHQPTDGTTTAEVADATGADADDELVDALSDTVAFARCLRTLDETPSDGTSRPGPTTRWCDRACRTVLRPLFDELASRRWRPGMDGPERRREAARIAERIGAGAGQDRTASVIGRGLAERLHELLADARTPALREAMAGLPSLIELMPACDERPDVASTLGLSATPVVHVVRNGPYLVEGGVTVTDRLGDERPVREPVALCRCGRSGSMPLCDGSHVAARFQGAKREGRVPDRLDRHAGQQLTILDNRGLCAHAGFCTDRLASVFHLGQEPFVSPSGARADRIMQAIDKCPSGALSLELDDRTERALPEPARPPSVEVSKAGPYRFTGNVALLDESGDPVEMPKGGTREHYSLCRCGASSNKPFCSGMHWNVTFEKPANVAEDQPSVYEWAGGQRLLLDMTRLFYSRHVPDDPLIGPLFASMSPDHPVRVAAWLSEVFGGPALYSERYGGYAHMIREHLGKRISAEQRARWVTLMARSADEAGLPDDAEFRAAFVSYLEWGSRLALENSQEGATPPPRMPMPRWSWVADAYPWNRTSAVASAEAVPASDAHATPIVVPGDGEPIRFEEHVRSLFRDKDRAAMRFAFDLWSEPDVREHGPAILGRLKAGTMPCDGGWPASHVDVFDRWLAQRADAGSDPLADSE